MPSTPRNWAMNGGFDVSQRVGTAQTLVTGTRAYGLDRWALVPSVASGTSAQMVQSTAFLAPDTRFSMNFGPWSTNNKCAAMQIIEASNAIKLRGKTMTLSGLFYGDVGYRLEVIAWTGTADAVTTLTNSVPYTNWGSYTLASSFVTCGSQSFSGTASTWNRYSLTVNIPSSATNIILALVKNEDNGIQNYASKITFNEGTVPMVFEMHMGDIDAEIRACQRFLPVYRGQGGVVEPIPGLATALNTSATWILPFPTQTLKKPTSVVVSANNHFNFSNSNGNNISSAVAFVGTTATTLNSTQLTVTIATVGGTTVPGWVYFNNASAYIYLEGAELG